MKLRWAVLVLVLLLFVIVSGCGDGNQNTLQKNYKIGYGALTLVLDEQRSPTMVYQNRPFSQVMTLFNKAGYPAQNVRVTMGSYDQTFLSVDNPQQFFPSVEANSAFNDDNGGRADLLFNGNVLSLRGAEERREPYRFYVSYDSRMEFAPTICVNTARYDIFDAGCEMPKRALSFAGQGAPLAVVSMEEVVVGGDAPELELRLKIADKGNGNVKNLRLGQARLGTTPLACQFRDVLENTDKSVSFRNNRRDGEVLCTATLSEKNSYQTTLFIEFFYSYEFSVAKELTIKP